MINGVFLLALCLSIVLQAIERYCNPNSTCRAGHAVNSSLTHIISRHIEPKTRGDCWVLRPAVERGGLLHLRRTWA